MSLNLRRIFPKGSTFFTIRIYFYFLFFISGNAIIAFRILSFFLFCLLEQIGSERVFKVPIWCVISKRWTIDLNDLVFLYIFIFALTFLWEILLISVNTLLDIKCFILQAIDLFKIFTLMDIFSTKRKRFLRFVMESFDNGPFLLHTAFDRTFLWYILLRAYNQILCLGNQWFWFQLLRLIIWPHFHSKGKDAALVFTVWGHLDYTMIKLDQILAYHEPHADPFVVLFGCAS